MTPIDHGEPSAASAGIVTRSDRVPTAHERYGIWARKFFGAGRSQAGKDRTIARSLLPDAGMVAPTRH